MRGAPGHAGRAEHPGRIIPADAGSTLRDGGWRARNGDHPRGCGEHGSVQNQSVQTPGSSPRMRVALRCLFVGLAASGIIPADAGSTTTAQLGRARWQDHPRGCGEHIIFREVTRPVRGSSPRMRGAPKRHSQPRLWRGIIPADAGSTQGWKFKQSNKKDHPRGCGEHRHSHQYTPTT